jgi:predicted nucleic acid-binding protein
VAELAVINASPLIFLSRGQHLDLLRHFADRILVPEPVAREIKAKGAQDLTVKALEGVSWLEIAPAPTVPESILEWGLGEGESSVLALAHESPGVEAIIDDLAARKCAAGLGVPVRGTLGIVLAANKERTYPIGPRCHGRPDRSGTVFVTPGAR